MHHKTLENVRVAVLDICGTLAPEDSWLALTRDMGGLVERHLQIFHDYREGRITYPESQDQLIGLWRATGKANRTAMRAIFESWPLDDASVPLVKTLRAHGYLPLIITGAVDLYAEVIAAKLGIEDWYANTPLVFDDAGNLVTYHYDLDQSGKKVRQLSEFCARHGFAMEQAIAFGDGPNDVGLFEATGHGIWLETPKYDNELRPLAWRTITRLADGIALLDQS
ncbi:MAG TPA: HAD-IB family phosphatase [Patescibacteria group bacterium]|nr:HAD-IB family phosphatase [Patescibacteria group bacterium]